MITSPPLGKVWILLWVWKSTQECCFREYCRDYWAYVSSKVSFTVVCFAETWPYQRLSSPCCVGKWHWLISEVTLGTHFQTVLQLEPETWVLCSSWSIKNKNSWNSDLPPAPLSVLNAVVNFLLLEYLKIKSIHTNVFIWTMLLNPNYQTHTLLLSREYRILVSREYATYILTGNLPSELSLVAYWIKVEKQKSSLEGICWQMVVFILVISPNV